MQHALHRSDALLRPRHQSHDKTCGVQGALAAYQAAAAMAPDVAANPGNCAAAAMMLRYYKAAAEYARAAIALDPAFLRAYSRAGKACLMMGRLGEVRAPRPPPGAPAAPGPCVGTSRHPCAAFTLVT